MFKHFIRLLIGSVRDSAEPAVGRVVEQSLAEVCNLVEGRLQGMTLAEARGFVRARATQVVMREARLAIANSADRDFTSLADVARRATERLIPQVIRKMYVGAQRTHRVAA